MKTETARMFQSTPPRRGRHGQFFTPTEETGFQSTPPRRGRRGKSLKPSAWITFQSTPPRRGRRYLSGLVPARYRFQSTPPRRGRPPARPRRRRGSGVSIHAPAQGATAPATNPGSGPSRFNPRPRAGGDRSYTAWRSSRQRFNPRPRAGGDLTFREIGVRVSRVSIHAPAQGATCPADPA